MDRALSQSLSPAEGELAEADLEQLEADYARLEAAEQLPSVPSVGINELLLKLRSAHVKTCTSVLSNMGNASALTDTWAVRAAARCKSTTNCSKLGGDAQCAAAGSAAGRAISSLTVCKGQSVSNEYCSRTACLGHACCVSGLVRLCRS